MTNITNLSTSELEDELRRRQQPPDAAPVPVLSPNWGPVIECITFGTAQSIKDGHENDDFQHYVYEAAMTAVYGDEYWIWRRKQRW